MYMLTTIMGVGKVGVRGAQRQMMIVLAAVAVAVDQGMVPVNAFSARLVVTAVGGSYSGCDDPVFGGGCEAYARFQVSGTGVGGGVGYRQTSAPNSDNTPTWNYAYPTVCASGAATVTFSVSDDDGGTFQNGDDTLVSTRSFTIPAYSPGVTAFTRTTSSTTFAWRWYPCSSTSYTAGCSGATLPCSACTSSPLHTGCATIGQDRAGSCGYGTHSYACRSRAPTRQPTRSPTTQSPTQRPTRVPTASTATPTTVPTASPTVAPTISPTALPTRSPTHHPCHTGQHSCVLPSTYCTDDLTTGAPLLGTGASQYACLCNLNLGFVTRQTSAACETAAPTPRPTTAPMHQPTDVPSTTVLPSTRPPTLTLAGTDDGSSGSGGTSVVPVVAGLLAAMAAVTIVGFVWFRVRQHRRAADTYEAPVCVNPVYSSPSIRRGSDYAQPMRSRGVLLAAVQVALDESNYVVLSEHGCPVHDQSGSHPDQMLASPKSVNTIATSSVYETPVSSNAPTSSHDVSLGESDRDGAPRERALTVSLSQGGTVYAIPFQTTESSYSTVVVRSEHTVGRTGTGVDNTAVAGRPDRFPLEVRMQDASTI